MPTEQSPSHPPDTPSAAGIIKCSFCGLGDLSTAACIGDGAGERGEAGERVCARCAEMVAFVHEGREESMEECPPSVSEIEIDHSMAGPSSPPAVDRPAPTESTTKHPAFTSRTDVSIPPSWLEPEQERPFDILLDLTKKRVKSIGRGALFPGSVFQGTQTSGRSSYDVQVKFIDVNFPESRVSGYLSISHLTESHPRLTTFFDGEIIGTEYGFITGPRFAATEQDDLRHWGRFDEFRRASTRADLFGDGLYLREPVLPDGRPAREREFVFLRIKEQFLVPDHKVKDILGASFAGFYYAMVDLTGGVPLPPYKPSVDDTTAGTFDSSGHGLSARSEQTREGRRATATAATTTSREATIRGASPHSLPLHPTLTLLPSFTFTLSQVPILTSYKLDTLKSTLTGAEPRTIPRTLSHACTSDFVQYIRIPLDPVAFLSISLT